MSMLERIKEAAVEILGGIGSMARDAAAAVWGEIREGSRRRSWYMASALIWLSGLCAGLCL